MPATRVMVVGNAGSGKSTLAAEIAAQLGCPVYSLDSVVWRPGWRKAPLHEKKAAVDALIRERAWVIDGVSEAVERAADVVVFLDVPWRRCVWRCAKRNYRYLFRSRPGLPERCPEWKIIPRLLKLLRRFEGHVRPGIVMRMHSDARYVHVTTAADYDLVRRRLNLRPTTVGSVVAAHRVA